MDQVILTPHAAWYSEKAFHEIREKAILNILDVYDGKKPKYLVNPNVLLTRYKKELKEGNE